MKSVFLLLLTSVMLIAGCDKSAIKEAEQTSFPVTNAVKTGDWMMTYFENNSSSESSLTFIKFNSNGTLAANKDGTIYNGTWAEVNTSSNHTLTFTITTTDVKLQRANRTWKVSDVSEYFINLQDKTAANITMQLMKH